MMQITYVVFAQYIIIHVSESKFLASKNEIFSLKYQVHVQLTLFFIAALTIPVKKIPSFMSTEHASIRSESYNSSPFLMALIFLAASLSPAKTNRYNNLNKLIYIIKDK